MKTLILVRHAKSSWADQGVDDFDRPLNDRGKKDGQEMAKRLHKRDIDVDLFVSSPARRARRTARYFAEEYGVDKDDILLVKELYLAAPHSFSQVITAMNDKHDSIAIFAHNPGITEFASSLTNVRIDDMPTCAVFAVSADTDSWSQFEQAEKKFLFFDYPKNPLS
jgi:phosphohistidine phosphatase